MLVRLLLTKVFFSVVYAEDIVNLINPMWKLPPGVNDGANIASEMAASIVGVDATATTYVIGCRPNVTFYRTLNFSSATRTGSFQCSTSEIAQTFTQGSTSMHWAMSDVDEIGSFTFTASYTFSRTLDVTVTATESWVRTPASFVRPSNVVGSSYTTTLSDATWYPITITAGAEKLAPSLVTNIPTTTTTTSLSSSTLSSTGVAAKATAKWLVAALGGAAALAI